MFKNFDIKQNFGFLEKFSLNPTVNIYYHFMQQRMPLKNKLSFYNSQAQDDDGCYRHDNQNNDVHQLDHMFNHNGNGE